MVLLNKILLLIFTLCIISINAYIVNPLYDYDPDTAPKVALGLNIRDTKVWLKGNAFSLYDELKPQTLKDFPTSGVTTTNGFAPANRELTTFINGPGEEIYVNETILLAYSNRTDSFIYEKGINLCFRVKNFNFNTYAKSFETLKRSGSPKLNLDIKEQIDRAFSHKKILNHAHNVNPKIYDMYHGMMLDISYPGSNSGCQSQFPGTSILVNRYAYLKYGEIVIAQWRNGAFYPFLGQLSSRNIIQVLLQHDTVTKDDLNPSFRQVIDEKCKNALDYCTYLFNGQCPYPSLPNIGCNSNNK